MTHIRVAVNSTDRTRIAGRRRRQASLCISSIFISETRDGQHKISETNDNSAVLSVLCSLKLALLVERQILQRVGMSVERKHVCLSKQVTTGMWK